MFLIEFLEIVLAYAVLAVIIDFHELKQSEGRRRKSAHVKILKFGEGVFESILVNRETSRTLVVKFSRTIVLIDADE